MKYGLESAERETESRILQRAKSLSFGFDYCSSCGEKIDRSTNKSPKYCSCCGEHVGIAMYTVPLNDHVCGHCKNSVSVGDKFCCSCGVKFTSTHKLTDLVNLCENKDAKGKTCNTELKEDYRHCPGCGSKNESY